MARSRSKITSIVRNPYQSYWAEYPFFLFGLGKFRRALKQGHQRIGFGVRGLATASQALYWAAARHHAQAAEARIPYRYPLWTVSTTFKYNYPAAGALRKHGKDLVLPCLASAREVLPRGANLYLTPERTWALVDEEVFFSGLLVNGQNQVTGSALNQWEELRGSFFYLALAATF